MTRRAVCLVVLAFGGCGGMPGEGTAYVLLDGDARSAGFRLEIDDQVASGLLPREADAVNGRVRLLAPDGRRTLDLRAGEVVWVRGREALVETLRLDEHVARDALLLGGPAEAIAAMASVLGASVVPAGARHRLEGPDAFLRAAWIDDAAAVDTVEPVLVTTMAPVAAPAGREPARDLLRALGGPAGADVEVTQPGGPGDEGRAAVVGVYVRPGRALYLDTAGHFSLEVRCHVTRGTYRVEGESVVLDADTGSARLERDAEGALVPPDFVQLGGAR